MKQPKTVAIIGAGPAGLVSARYVLEAGLQPTMFNKAPHIGGTWSPSEVSWDSLTTNVSRNVVSFSDLPWPDEASVFPHKTELHSYLKAYADKFLGAILGTNAVKLECEVVNVSQVNGAEAMCWAVQWIDSSGRQLEDVFNHVVIATGFFSKPDIPSIPGMPTFLGPLLHSSQYRRPNPFTGMRVAVVGGLISALDIATDLAPVAKEVVQVFPCSTWMLPPFLPLEPHNPATPFVPRDWVLLKRLPKVHAEGSAPDAQASADAPPSADAWPPANALPSAGCRARSVDQTSTSADQALPSADGTPHPADHTPPSADLTPLCAGCTPPSADHTLPPATHVPPSAEQTPPSADHTPLPADRITPPSSGHALSFANCTVPPASAPPCANAPPGTVPSADHPSPATDTPPTSVKDWWRWGHGMLKSMCGDLAYMVHSDFKVDEENCPPYMSTVQDPYFGMVRAGKLKVVKGRVVSFQENALLLQSGVLVPDVDAVIMCTGYTPSITYLPDDILSAIDFNPTEKLMPILTHKSVWHPKLPGMAFVGMYRNRSRNLNFAEFELQARWVAAVFSGAHPVPSVEEQNAGIAQHAAIRAMRPRPQFVGMALDMSDFIAEELGLMPPERLLRPGQLVLSQHYSGDVAMIEAAEKRMQALMQCFRDGHMVASRVFSSLQGEWNMRLTVDSCSSHLADEAITGTARFELASSTHEYMLYEDTGLGSAVQQVWQYDAKLDKITICAPQNGHTGPKIAQVLTFFPPREGDDSNLAKPGWRADGGSYVSREETHSRTYRFAFSAIHVYEIEVAHCVKGYGKEYSSTRVYTRQVTSSPDATYPP